MTLGKDAVASIVVAAGGRVVAQISGQTTHLVIGLEPGAKKLADADKRGIEKVSLSELNTLLDAIQRQASTGSATPLHVQAATDTNSIVAIDAATTTAIARAAADLDPTLAYQRKHFQFFAKRKWTVVEAGANGNCFFHSVLLVNKIQQYSTVMPRTHAAVRKQVVAHMRANADTLVVCEQPMASLLDARAPSYLANMQKAGVYVEYEVIGGFSHLINEAVIVYSQQCGTPLVISVSLCYL